MQLDKELFSFTIVRRRIVRSSSPPILACDFEQAGRTQTGGMISLCQYILAGIDTFGSNPNICIVGSDIPSSILTMVYCRELHVEKITQKTCILYESRVMNQHVNQPYHDSTLS